MSMMSVSGARGVTPRGQGPSGSTAPSYSGTGHRRGAGPRAATPTRGQGSSSSSVDTGLPPGIPKFNLTIEQELEILERLETGNYVRGAGLYQFLPNGGTDSNSDEKKVKSNCKQNLLGAFESENRQENRTMLSTWSAEDTATLQVGVADSTGDSSLDKVDDQDDYELPEHCKKLDELMVAMDCYKKLMNYAVESVFEARFAELFPQRIVKVVEKMEKAATILQTFLNENANKAESTKLFFPSPTKNKATVSCPVKDQEDFINTLYNLSEVTEKFHKYLSSQKKEIDLDAKIQLFADAVSKFENNLKEGEESLTSVEELSEFVDLFLPTNLNSSDSSGISLN